MALWHEPRSAGRSPIVRADRRPVLRDLARGPAGGSLRSRPRVVRSLTTTARPKPRTRSSATRPCIGSRRDRSVSAQPGAQQCLPLLGALPALALRAPEEVGQLGVAVALRVLHGRIEPEHGVEALLDEPDDVVILVLRAGDAAGFLAAHGKPPG